MALLKNSTLLGNLYVSGTISSPTITDLYSKIDVINNLVLDDNADNVDTLQEIINVFQNFKETDTLYTKAATSLTKSSYTHTLNSFSGASLGSFTEYALNLQLGGSTKTTYYPLTEAKTFNVPVFVKSGTSAAMGLVPAPSTTAGTTKFLREDATWATISNTYRPVNVNGTAISALASTTTTALDLVAGTNISITDSGNGKITIASTHADDTNKVFQDYQAHGSYTNWRPLLVGASNSTTEGFTPSDVTDYIYSFSTLTVQPSSGTIKATTFKGDLTGTAAKATKVAITGNQDNTNRPIALLNGYSTTTDGIIYTDSGNNFHYNSSTNTLTTGLLKVSSIASATGGTLVSVASDGTIQKIGTDEYYSASQVDTKLTTLRLDNLIIPAEGEGFTHLVMYDANNNPYRITKATLMSELGLVDGDSLAY